MKERRQKRRRKWEKKKEFEDEENTIKRLLMKVYFFCESQNCLIIYNVAVQGDQFNMAVLFWYSDEVFCPVYARHCTAHVHCTRFTRYQKTRPCLTGHPVYKLAKTALLKL